MNQGLPSVRALAAHVFLVFVTLSVILPPQTHAQRDRLCFNVPGIVHCIEGRFREYWEQNGGLAVFGYPLTAAENELNYDTGATYLTQWFERNRFELHPANQAPYDVLLGRLGDDRLRQRNIDWQTLPREEGPKHGCLWFEQTGHNVCDQAPGLGFRTYWERNGIADRRLDAYQRSLALFGMPLTAPRLETNSSGDTVLTQWFERARFEWHADKPDAFKVLLARLGDEVRGAASDVPRPSGRIVYVSAKDIFTGGDLYVMNADGTGQTRLTWTNSIPLEAAEYVVSPAGDRIAYRVGLRLMVMRLDAPGATPQEIATAARREPLPPQLFEPTWAPDGSHLAYVLNNDIYASRLDGSPPVQVTHGAGIDMPACLSWARNGYLTFRTPARHTFKLFVVRSDGSDLRQIAWGLCGTLSPAGDQMLSINGDLWLVNLDGTNSRNLTSGRNFLRGSWSQDGTRIVAVGYTSDDPYDRDIFVVDAASGRLQQLTTEPDLDIMPDWSPDGKFITFASKRTQRYGVYVMHADGTNQMQLPTAEESAAPQWAAR